MGDFRYSPDQDIKVHEEGAIRLLCKPFQSHETGLPEWLKNSADAYARGDAPETGRVVIVILTDGRDNIPPSISCLDFVGMHSAAIEDDFRIWADPDAARRGGKASAIQGGHGNGGKCYMTQMFEDHAQLVTVRGGLGNCYGVSAGSVRFGYIPDRERGRDFPVAEPRDELKRALRAANCPLKVVQQVAEEAVASLHGFTLITGVRPRGYDKRIPAHKLIDNLMEHPQMILTLEFCSVFAIVNGRVFEGGKRLTLPVIEPIPGYEQPREVPVPDVLPDPVSGNRISTTENGRLPGGKLLLRTSKVSMRWSKKGRHVVSFVAQSGYIGYALVAELDIQSAYRDRIYGECHLEALEPYKQNERSALARSPLTRAVHAFVGAQVQAYANEFEARDRHHRDQEEKNALSRMNEALDRWKNHLLTEILQGLWGQGTGTNEETRPPLPVGVATKLELASPCKRAGLGVSFRPALRFFDKDGKRIRPVPYRWLSEDNNVAMVDDDLLIINTFAYGKTAIHAETLQGKVGSNAIPLEVVRVHEISIVPNQVTVPAGSRVKLDAVCKLHDGEETGSVLLVWTEGNPSVARVSAAGMVFGFAPGKTEVVAGDDKCMAKSPATIEVTPSEGRDGGSKEGRGYPKVLVSEVDPDPVTSEPVVFAPDDPPVHQRPQDVERNIWWINSSAPLARLYLDQASGYGHQSREWRMYHLERYVEVLAQIALTNGPDAKESLQVGEWISRWGDRVVQIQVAAANSLAQFIATGELPDAE
jgi:Bacterial Ig-like domain (group 2)